MPKKWEVWKWDFCPYFRARGFPPAPECIGADMGIDCERRGRCVIASVRVKETKKEGGDD